MTDALTGDHIRFITKTIFELLGLTYAFYRHEPAYLGYPELTNTYWDRYSNGIVATPVEAVKFMKGLMEGKLLSPSTLAEMQSWVTASDGNPRYGLGLGYATFNGQTAYGHSGGGIGAGCELRYFLEKDLYVFVAINLGAVTESPLHEGAAEARYGLFGVLVGEGGL